MDLRTDYPYWLLNKGLLASYPGLEENITTDVAIIGGGISGALVAWHLAQAGVKCIIVDKRHIGMGSTAATTGLLQYETDTSLVELAERIGTSNAASCYHLCSQAIDQLEKISSKHPHAEFKRLPSLQYASFKRDCAELQKEYTLRTSIGLDVQWIGSARLKELYGFNKPAALLSKQGAIVNAYGLAHSLIPHTPGLKVYDRTNIKSIVHRPGSIELHTDEGFQIKARKVVVACGYESGSYMPKRIDQLYTTYALVSQPLPDKEIWYKNSLIWETAENYCYLRTTLDNRIMMGGKDDDFTSPVKREDALPRKIKALERSFKALFPHIPLKTDFYWAGNFASTKDGLPYIGALPGRHNLYFALGFGGNGIVFSQLAANILTDLITGKPNRHSALFALDR